VSKERLDILLVERELARSRSRAKALIMAGDVYVDGQRVDKAGTKIDVDAEIEVRGGIPYVSRGGLKLQAALDAFEYDCNNKVVIDVGASTGGFTDCVLQRGAARVYAVDVGYGQLAWKLRQDDRVIVIERTNIRHMKPDAIDEACDLAVIDCSFISLELVLPNTLNFLKPHADVITLVKPQFEAGPENVGKGGVVRDEDARHEAIEKVVETARELGLHVVDRVDSPVHGPAGNVEHLIWFERDG
jgi:23S rRNA (cytidine1920-2'-O)/16S rRNA (cytidine1409-2'-O)-methyltransferase